MTNSTFDSLGLSLQTLEAIKKIKYVNPMPVQAQVIPFALAGKDIIASAQTGSGKTAAFTIPLLDILSRDKQARCLIVAPTRELAQQIHKVFGELSVQSDIKSVLIVGGKFMQDQLKKLKKDPRVVIGTPGRLNDHIKRKSLVLSDTKYVVWDEMDRMLALGFIHQIEHIMKNLPQDRQTLMFSATFPKRVLTLAETYLKEPQKVIIDSLNSVSQNIEQKTINTENNLKPIELKKIIDQTKGQIIVFTKTQKATENLAKNLQNLQITACALHGALRQSKRETITKGFRASNFKVLVATDVAARGLDIPKIACVVNYELPQSPEEYIHRIGRTGRVAERGLAITLLMKSDKKNWREIQDFLKSGDEKELSAEEQRKLDMLIEKERNSATPFSPDGRKGKKDGHRKDSYKKEKQHPARRLDTRPKAMREKKQSEKAIPQDFFDNKKEKNKKESAIKNTSKKAKKPADNKANKKAEPVRTQTKKEYEYSPFKKVFVGKRQEKKPKHDKGKETANLWRKVIENKKGGAGRKGPYKGRRNKGRRR